MPPREVDTKNTTPPPLRGWSSGLCPTVLYHHCESKGIRVPLNDRLRSLSGFEPYGFSLYIRRYIVSLTGRSCSCCRGPLTTSTGGGTVSADCLRSSSPIGTLPIGLQLTHSSNPQTTASPQPDHVVASFALALAWLLAARAASFSALSTRSTSLVALPIRSRR